MPKSVSSQKRIPTEVWVALIGLVGVLVTALLTSPILTSMFQRTPVPDSTAIAAPNVEAVNTPISASVTDDVTPKPVEESMVIVTLQNDEVVQFPLSTLYINFGDGKSLTLYDGVKVAFATMESFEIVKDEGDDNITVTIILLDGQSRTARIDTYAASQGEIQGNTSFGPFSKEFHDLKKVEFQR